MNLPIKFSFTKLSFVNINSHIFLFKLNYFVMLDNLEFYKGPLKKKVKNEGDINDIYQLLDMALWSIFNLTDLHLLFTIFSFYRAILPCQTLG